MSALATPRRAAYTVERYTDDAAWHALRATGIGSSDCAAALDLDPYRSQTELFLEKIGAIAPPDLSGNDAVQTGLDLEDYVAQRYERKTGHTVRRVNATWRSVAYPFMVANVDRVVVGMQRILECKTAGFWAGQSEEWGDPELGAKDAVPVRYHCQTTHQMIVAGWAECDLAVLVAGQRLGGPYTIARDAELVEMIVEGERALWKRVEEARKRIAAGEQIEYVVKVCAPPVTRRTDLTLRFPRSQSKPIEATPDLAKLYWDMVDDRKARDVADEAAEAKQIAICAFMGECDELTYEGMRLATYRSTKPRATFDAKAHAKAQPDCHAQFAGEGSPSRPFRIEEPK